MNKTTKIIARAGVTAALYIVASLFFGAMSFGPQQIRIGEALTILPLIMPETAIGLVVGCFITNLIGSTPIDMLLGTAATAAAAVTTLIAGRFIKNTILKLVLGEIGPIAINALVVPITFFAASDVTTGYFANVLSVGLGQLISIGVFGTILFLMLNRLKVYKETLGDDLPIDPKLSPKNIKEEKKPPLTDKADDNNENEKE